LETRHGNTEHDVIVVGSGPGGATVARELSRRGKRVLILERGGNGTLKETIPATVSILSAVSVSDGLLFGRAFTTGGTTAIYLAVAEPPPMDTYRAFGIDLQPAYDEAKAELPLAEVPDSLLRPHSIRIRESAKALGYAWARSPMLVDQSKCKDGYSYEAKWTARSFVHEAVANGATLLNRARVTKVLIEDGRAVGVEYKLGSKKSAEVRRAYGAKVVLAPGGAATPVLLRASGVRNVADRGFYCHPNYMVFGTISGLKGGDGYGGTEGTTIDGDIHVGDGNVSRTFYRMLMLGNRRWLRAFLHSRTIGMGVMITDPVSGELRADGRYYKELTKEDRAKLAKGGEVARKIIEHAGGKDVFTTTPTSAHIGGAIRFGEHIDSNLETEFANLHVCDGSLMPDTRYDHGYGIITPTLTLVCLGKYLTNHLMQRL